ncbi:MAG: transketolase [Prolixibacteraceae bacterium]|nr:transketolase [Prolixibacteraceae bacterium]MBN2774537.1 transketolase [Prolixibacteraceae bacterium]
MYLEKMDVLTASKTNYKEILNDYYTVCLSRQLSLLGRREVHNGRAHFGIFGDGKEVAQIALAKTFHKGDWRSGYYRDQTFMLALDLLKPEEFFAMIYGDTDTEYNPSTGGRNFNNHFSTPNINEKGEIKNLSGRYNSASDISPTGGQMPRLLGLAQASKLVRENPGMKKHLNNNITGNEVAFGSIGDAGTSEGMFFETINAAGVMQVPLAIAVYDDGYGISVPVDQQTTKASISEALKGFQKQTDTNGIQIYTCKGWDYPSLVKTFSEGIKLCRDTHTPVVFHIQELTQPTGHSTSGSHERYKSKERLEWEKEFDGIAQFKKWIIEQDIADFDMLIEIEKSAEKRARDAKNNAWKHYKDSFTKELSDLEKIFNSANSNLKETWLEGLESFKNRTFPTRRSLLSMAKRIAFEINENSELKLFRANLHKWIENFQNASSGFYNKHIYREGIDSALNVNPVSPEYKNGEEELTGSEIINRNFDALFAKYPSMVTFGEDTGKLGGVNQGMKGMQEKYGEARVSDTGIRETTIIGQGIGLALRGFRPIAEIQYLDYLIYAQSTLSDDLATMQYRTGGKQAAPVIIRTRGHQLQGMWHAGSPMQLLLGSLRGIYICVPRNMTQAAGFYNSLLEANDPAIVIEPLKGYGQRELAPSNFGDFKIPLGVPEIITEGTDLTIVTYGWNVFHAAKAASLLENKGISVEVIDVQTLMPFDIHHKIFESVKKTNKVLFVDEDVPGGATAYMLQKTLDEQKIFNYLDTAPRTLSAKEHRPAYGIDGEYFSKPNVELIYETVWEMMRETDIKKFAAL